MPREQINYPSTGPSYALTPGAPATFAVPTEPEFSIHWSTGPTAYAQISVDLDVATVEQYIAQLRNDSPGDTRMHFYSDMLDRGSLQRIIKAARRARDSVHGADE